MDSAFPFVSSSDRSKYMELCQALSNLNALKANPDLEDPVDIRTQERIAKEVVTDEIVDLQPAVPGKALPDSRKPLHRAKSQSNSNQRKGSSDLQHGNKQIQEVVTKRVATPTATGDQKKNKSVMSNQRAPQPSKALYKSQFHPQFRMKGKQVSSQEVFAKCEVQQ